MEVTIETWVDFDIDWSLNEAWGLEESGNKERVKEGCTSMFFSINLFVSFLYLFCYFICLYSYYYSYVLGKM